MQLRRTAVSLAAVFGGAAAVLAITAFALSGHGRPFTDVAGHITANRSFVAEHLEKVRSALADGPKTAFELAQVVYGEEFNESTASWLLAQTRSWLTHLDALGEASHDAHTPERWA